MKGAPQFNVKVKKTTAIINTDRLMSPITVTDILLIATST
jgi:hypothetical protein